ncbi:MAG TPA: plastocyanin/azurin family copper-binding protein [Candidatus Limnocylindrales bacterium]
MRIVGRVARPASRWRDGATAHVAATVAATTVLLCALVLVLAGCAGAGAAASPVSTSTVDLPPSYVFRPAAIVVHAGTTVTWTNHDNFTHSVQFLDGGLPTTPAVMDPGKATSFTFATPGVYHYQCSFHPQNMQGSVTVTP